MTEEIINSDGSRNWQANILLDNIKRLEQENRALRKANEISIEKVTVTAEAKRLKELEQENKELKETIKQYCEWLDEERESNDKLQKVYQNDHCDLLNYRFALAEIQKAIKSYDLAVDNGVSVDTLYTIGKIINEVLS